MLNAGASLAVQTCHIVKSWMEVGDPSSTSKPNTSEGTAAETAQWPPYIGAHMCIHSHTDTDT